MKYFINISLVGMVSFFFGCGDGDGGAGGLFDNAKVTKVTVKAGDVTITDREGDGLSHVKIECNNGLVVDADWERNSANDFGYDIYEPEVNRDTNRLAVMILARTVIANYLKGEYD